MNIYLYSHNDINFEWREGAYIDIFYGEREYAEDVINVWDYAKDTPRIPKTYSAFLSECKKKLKEMEVL